MHVPVNFSSNDENQKECCVTEKNKARPACLRIKVVVLTKVQSFWFAQFHLKSDTTADMRQSVHPGTQCVNQTIDLGEVTLIYKLLTTFFTSPLIIFITVGIIKRKRNSCRCCLLCILEH